MNNLKSLLYFVAGAGIGSAVTWYILKEKYQAIAQEEIDSVKDRYTKKEKELAAENTNMTLDEMKEQARNKPDISEYVKKINKTGYTNYSDADGKNEAQQEERPIVFANRTERPYVISPDEFGEIDEYAVIELLYFEDGIVADNNYEILENLDDVIGEESLNHFGEYEDDAVHVRNDRLKSDYEILIDRRRFRDIRRAVHQNNLDDMED